jgi:molybdopterin-containing oxidoreductase family iron-sulfur binding subunit
MPPLKLFPQDSPEFPPEADQPPEGVSRRQALELAAFSAAMGLSACFRPANEELVPYVSAQPGVPGVPQHYATALELQGYARGLVVTAYEHRPTKIEGNVGHPDSLGAAGAHEQAALLGLFDSHRAQLARLPGRAATRLEVLEWLRARAARDDQGEGLYLLAEPSASPQRARLYQRLTERYPRAQVVPLSATLTGNAQAGARLAFGRALAPVHRFSQARCVVSLDQDFLSTLPGDLKAAREWADARAGHGDARLWCVETALSVTGMFSDQRLSVRPSRVPAVARALGAAVGALLGDSELEGLSGGPKLTGPEQRWVELAARDLASHRGAAHVVAGERQPPEVHALAHLVAHALGAIGGPVYFVSDPLVPQPELTALPALKQALEAGAVDTLLITAWNPVYAAPPELGFAAALARAKHCLYCGLHEDETALSCSAFAPSRHPFECWGDGRAHDGTVAIRQPLVAPLFDGLFDPDELVGAFVGDEPPLDRLRAFWADRIGHPKDFAELWRQWLSDGFVAGTALPPTSPKLDRAAVLDAVRALPPPPPSPLELSLTPDLKVFDGRFAGNPWLQELPDPVTKLTWDGAALVSPATAEKLGLERGTQVRLSLGHAQLEVPVLPVPGHADDAVTLPLGYGRRLGTAIADGLSFDANTLRSVARPWSASGLVLEKLDRPPYIFAITQDHWTMHGRDIALQLSPEELERMPPKLERLREPQEHLYPVPQPFGPPEHRWGMAVDLDRCTGCSACVVACQAENNVPPVGKQNVIKGREMHWLRIDRYFTGPQDEPQTLNQPMMCVHCEYAPCEYVCPVFATVHSTEGLNEMVYNRCVGTRYCSNNCPYKVRRFNYLDYVPREPFARARQNPSVTVRSRGVMEKCTYCVQRIEGARIAARAERRPMRDGDVVTACQQACPTHAIVFGDLSDPGSEVARLHATDRAYRVLADRGTEPRTAHLVRLRHPVKETSR